MEAAGGGRSGSGHQYRVRRAIRGSASRDRTESAEETQQHAAAQRRAGTGGAHSKLHIYAGESAAAHLSRVHQGRVLGHLAFAAEGKDCWQFSDRMILSCFVMFVFS